MSVVHAGVQREIREPRAAHVDGVQFAGGEGQPFRGDAAQLGLTPQGVAGFLSGVEQPQHGAGHAAQDVHPCLEGFPVYFIGLVEAAENEGLFGKAVIAPP